MPGPDIDFRRIRPHGQPAGRQNAFEELSSILLQDGVVEWPSGTRFQRFGNPDGGREGRGVLPTGEVWAWQSKYVFAFDASEAAQVTSSVKRVLDTEPAMTRYYVTLPFDLPAGDTEKSTSAQTRWEDKVTEWKALASERGMDVQFLLVGAHELTSALTLATNEGRARYWFDAEILTDQWQRRRLEEAVVKAGRRYTPELHVNVRTVQALHAVARAAPFLDRWRGALAELREARRWDWRSPTDLPVFETAVARCNAALTVADVSLAGMIADLESSDRLPVIDQDLADGLEAVAELDHLLQEHCLIDGRYYTGEAASLTGDSARVRGALWEARELARGVLQRAADTKRLVITGRAGTGKTHLFCDVASRRIGDGRPTLLVLGQDFDGRNLLSQFAEITQLDGRAEPAIASFSAAAEASGQLGLVMIDALNESDRSERWSDDLRTFLSIIDRYPNLAVVVSCRFEFVDAVLGAEDRPTVDHPGFAEATDRAISRYAEEYGLEAPTFPVLGPEFSNPLFLKLACEALYTLGEARFLFGSAGVTTVCEAFLEAVNRRLAGPSRCDYDKVADPVTAVVRELALVGGGTFDRGEVTRMTELALPGDRGWSRSLLRGLLAEGVLIEAGRDRIAFGYQRLGDLVRATHLTEQGTDAVRAWFAELEDQQWRERGMLGALAVVVPEQHGVEFFELVAGAGGRIRRDVADAFLQSLQLRAAQTITTRAVTAVRTLLSRDMTSETWGIWTLLLRIACVPGHPLNADWVHERLGSLELAERDATWSKWLIGSLGDDGDESPLGRIIDWAWPIDLDRRRPVSDDVASLATTCLAWVLTTTDRRVRDRATKALTSIAEHAPIGFGTGIARFSRVNDPYVVERLAGAACGAALRTDDPDALRHLADGVAALLADGWPDHLLTRDYARRVVDAAQVHGWAGSLPASAPGPWPMPSRSTEEIEAIAGEPGSGYSSIWYSLTSMGDFGRYILSSAVEHVGTDDEQTLVRDVERAVFERVLDLGWTSERFQNMDKHRHGGHDGPVERVGKKYQWIAFYEVLGRLTDHNPVRPLWGENDPRPYEQAEQIVWRDIDPTILVRKPARHDRQGQQVPWFAPVVADFPSTFVDEYPSDVVGVPDPLDLLAVADGEGSDWIVLVGNHTWEQPLPVEVVAQRVPRLATWMHLHAYLVPTAQVDDLAAWASDQDWFGRWMPEAAEPHNLLLGDHPDGPGWEAAGGAVEWWPIEKRGPLPADLRLGALWYGGTGTRLDASAPDETHGLLPTRPLVDTLGLSKGRDFQWQDSSGLAVWDPSAAAGGPSLLAMRRDLASRLHAEGTALFWTVLASRELHQPDHHHPGDEYRWVTASASYVFDGNQIRKIHSLAKRCRPGWETEHEVDWAPRSAG